MSGLQLTLGPYLHAYMLPRWGMPIGELWGLEGLAEKCRKAGRYKFFLTSAPDNVPGKSTSLTLLCGNLFVTKGVRC